MTPFFSWLLVDTPRTTHIFPCLMLKCAWIPHFGWVFHRQTTIFAAAWINISLLGHIGSKNIIFHRSFTSCLNHYFIETLNWRLKFTRKIISNQAFPLIFPAFSYLGISWNWPKIMSKPSSPDFPGIFPACCTHFPLVFCRFLGHFGPGSGPGAAAHRADPAGAAARQDGAAARHQGIGHRRSRRGESVMVTHSWMMLNDD